MAAQTCNDKPCVWSRAPVLWTSRAELVIPPLPWPEPHCPAGVTPSATHSTDPPRISWDTMCCGRLQAGVRLQTRQQRPAGRTLVLNASTTYHKRLVQLQNIFPNQFCISAAGISPGGNISQENKLLALQSKAACITKQRGNSTGVLEVLWIAKRLEPVAACTLPLYTQGTWRKQHSKMETGPLQTAVEQQKLIHRWPGQSTPSPLCWLWQVSSACMASPASCCHMLYWAVSKAQLALPSEGCGSATHQTTTGKH